MDAQQISSIKDRFWDSRLNMRGVVLSEYKAQPGETYWRCIEGRWYDKNEVRQIGPDHHILIDTLDENGLRLPGVQVQLFNGGQEIKRTEAKPGDLWAVDFPMYAAGHGYSVRVLPASDVITRMGLGSIEEPNRGHHSAYRFVFQLTTADGGTPPLPPGPQPPGDFSLREELLMLRNELFVMEAHLDALIAKYG